MVEIALRPSLTPLKQGVNETPGTFRAIGHANESKKAKEKAISLYSLITLARLARSWFLEVDKARLERASIR